MCSPKSLICSLQNRERKQTIMNVLQEDPRSTYLREKWGNNQYIFRMDDIRVLCKFDDIKATVTVEKILNDDDDVTNPSSSVGR